MVKKYILAAVMYSIISCKNDNTKNKILVLENEKLKKEIELNKLKDSVKSISTTMGKLEKQNIYSLDYIKNYSEKYPYEVKLYEKGILHDRIFKLLGKKNYQKFIDYSAVESPIEIINGKTFFGKGGAAHSFGVYEAAILVDFQKNLVSIAILDESKILFYSEDKSFDNNPKNVTNSNFIDWYYNVENNIEVNKE